MLASTIREIIAPVIRECPPECGIVSITRVEVSSDFSYATVYVSALDHLDKALEFLAEQLPRLHKDLGSLYRKKIPTVRFRRDTESASSARLDELLNS
jgi:ribosome-binding factor A